MLDLLRDYLNQVSTPEVGLQVEKACQALEKIEADDYEYQIEEYLQLDDTVEPGVTEQRILALLYNQLHDVLHDHAIWLSVDMNMDMLADIVLGLIDLQQHEEKTQLIAATGDDITVNERFCELMRFVTRYEVEELLPHVNMVSPSFINMLQQQEEEAQEFEPEEVMADRRQKIETFLRYDASLPEGAPATMKDVLRSGVDVGLPFQLYIGLVGEQFEKMQTEEIAETVFGFAMISFDGASDPVGTIKAHLETYLSNPDTITAVVAMVQQLMARFFK